VYPALAVYQALMAPSPETEVSGLLKSKLPSILWVGGIGGMEANLVNRKGLAYQEIPAAGVHGVGVRILPRNLWQIGRGLLASRRILQEYQPDVLFFTGGYVAVPMALAGRITRYRRRRPRVLLYVPDIEPGLALKTLARFADHIAISGEETRRFLSRQAGVTLTGYPTRAELSNWAKSTDNWKEGRRLFGLKEALPLLLVFGGSKGARSINRALLTILPDLLAEMQVLHISGTLDWEEIESSKEKLVANIPPEQASRYRVFPYLHDEMGAALAAADLVVCRAGASTLGELPLFGLPAILVPYPYAWRYQQVNAEHLAQNGAATILQDGDLSKKLRSTVQELLRNPEKLEQMRIKMRSLAHPQAAQSIANLIYSLVQPDGGAG